jgi:hypothetical protein
MRDHPENYPEKSITYNLPIVIIICSYHKRVHLSYFGSEQLSDDKEYYFITEDAGNFVLLIVILSTVESG